MSEKTGKKKKRSAKKHKLTRLKKKIRGMRQKLKRTEFIINPVRFSVFVLLLGVFTFSLVKLIGIGSSYLKNRKAYRELQNVAVVTAAPEQTPVPDTPQTELSDRPEEAAAENEVSGETGGEEETSETEAPENSELPFTPDWEQLKTVCPDIIGWLYQEGTNIHYPVVQRHDNNTFYLTHNARQEENSGGALFMDALCMEESDNLIIYGHRMKDDSMFGQIPNYSEKSYVQTHPVMYYMTPSQNYRVEIFACRTVKAEEKYFETVFETTNDYRMYLEKAVEQSYWAAPVTPDTEHKTLTLATCSSYRGLNDPRILVHGKLVPIE